MAARGVRLKRWRRKTLPVGRRDARPGARIFRLQTVGSRTGPRLPTRTKRVWSGGAPGQRLGVDREPIRALRGVQDVSVLRRILREFLRWQALCDEGWLGAHRSKHAAAILPKLVPAALSIRVCGIPLRQRWIQIKEGYYANKRNRCTSGRRVCHRHTKRTD